MRRLASPVAVLLAVGLAGAAQDPPAQTPEVVIPVGTELVRVDVIVTDKGGKARPGLRREDFQIVEDGQPQTITQFEAFAASAGPPTGPLPSAVPAAAETAPQAPRPVPRRFIVLAVDDIHIEAANLMRLKKTLDSFLNSEVAPEDMVALVTTSGRRSQDLTDDRHTMRQVVARLSLQDRRPKDFEIPYITGYQAELIERGDPEALMVAVMEIQARRPTPNPEAEAKAVARMVLHESINDARATFETVHNVARGMAGLPGRKVILFVSDGFTSGFGVDTRAALDLRSITDAGTRSGVIIYALDTRGLQPNTSFTAQSRGPAFTPGGGALFGARERLRIAGELASQDAMNAMAAETGGFLVANTNNLSDALRRFVRDTDVYYQLAYETTNAKRDGGFRKIEVHLPDVKDVRIRHRKGYYAPNDKKPGLVASAGASGTAPAGSTSPMDSLREEMRTALTSLEPLRALPVSMSADFVSTDPGVTHVVVSGYVDLRDVPFVRTADRRLATVDVAGAVFDEGGAVVGSLAIERAALDLTEARYKSALAKGLPYQRAAPLKPGRYRVSVAVREGSGGKLGSATQWVEIPDLGQGALTLSSLFLMKEDVPVSAKRASASAAPSLREVQAHRVYGQDERLYVQFFVYNLEKHAEELVTQTEIWRGGNLMAASPPQPLESQAGAAPGAAYTRRIKLRPFGPGDYEVRIVVKAARADASASQRAGFRIE